MDTSYFVQPGAATMKDIDTATIFCTAEEWARFQQLAVEEDRRQAKQLVALAKRAAVSPESFRLITRPLGGKATYQIKTKEANPFLKVLARAVDPDGSKRVTLSDIVESLIRGVSVQ